jgi:hypothetical protein
MALRKSALVCALALAGAASALAQPGPPAQTPNRWGYAYPRSLDAEIAAPDVHSVHYQDDHIMLMEVSNPPGYRMQMHGHPYPSVFAQDAASAPAGAGLVTRNPYLDPASPQNGQNWRNAAPAKGDPYPKCVSADPQAPHQPSNDGAWPLHFFRVEFVRIDQDDTLTFAAHYARTPARKVLFETPALRFVEVTLRPGARASALDSSYASVLAFDTVRSFEAVRGTAGPDAAASDPPRGMTAPRCMITLPSARPAIVNRTGALIHYYQFVFKRVDGAGLKDHWREWYPNMIEMQKKQRVGS